MVYDSKVGTRRILVVDDDPQLVRLVARYLEHLGYEVVNTGGTAEGWELVEAEPEAFRLAIIDVTMARPAGEELAWRILTARPLMHVILTSGYPADLSRVEDAFPGRIRFLQKPFSGEMLAAAVKEI
jgi:DNA-binding NtrC family response regulator